MRAEAPKAAERMNRPRRHGATEALAAAFSVTLCLCGPLDFSAYLPFARFVAESL
jgi:hypothetical protein